MNNLKEQYRDYRRQLPTLSQWKDLKNYKGKSLSSEYRYKKQYNLFRDTALNAKINELGGDKAVFGTGTLSRLFDDVYGDVDMSNLIPNGANFFRFNAKDKEVISHIPFSTLLKQYEIKNNTV